MKCQNCGKEFSDTVYPLHLSRCSAVEVAQKKKEELPKVAVEVAQKKKG